MSFSKLHPYFETIMTTVDPLFTEWEDAFNVANIPSSILDMAWHFEVLPFRYTGTAHTCLGFECPVKLKAFIKGYRTPKDAVDSALVFAEAIVKEACLPSNRLTQPTIKNVLPSQITVDALAQSNDNTAVLSIDFICTVYV